MYIFLVMYIKLVHNTSTHTHYLHQSSCYSKVRELITCYYSVNIGILNVEASSMTTTGLFDFSERRLLEISQRLKHI